MAQRFKTPITIEGATAASSQAVAANVDGDIQNRVQIDAGGKITWGDGSTAGDTNLYRDAANALKTDDTLEAASGLITLTTTGAPTASLADGAIAIDTTNDELYIRSGGAWVKQGGGGAAQSDTAPSNPVAGDLWYETDTGAMYVYYDSAWIEVGTAGVIAMQTSSTPPTTPGNGDLWFDTDTAKTYLYYDDGSSAQWVEVGAASAAASGTDGSIQFASGGALSSDASNLVWDDTNNRLGIGTTTPSTALHVAGSILSDDSVTIGSGGEYVAGSIYSDANWGMILRAKQASPAQAEFRFANSSDTELMRIDSSGNVGINDTTPSYKLDVNGDINTTGALRTDGKKTGLVLVASADFTSVTSAEFRNAFTTEFDNYQLHLSGVTCSAQEWMYFRGWYGSTLLSTNTYDNQRMYGHTTSVGAQKDVLISYGKFLPMGGNPTSFVVNISSPMVANAYTLTTAYGLYSDNNTLGYVEINNTFVRSTAQMDGMRFGGVSGSSTFSGRWELYGCPK